MRIGICPGSFDPVTLGHMDIISRACKIFDKVIVAVPVNPDKRASFTVEERMEMLRTVTASAGAWRGRRIMVRTRATSSRGENGLVM